MNVFILNSGRCGSSTFIHACQHISNYTAAHESRSRLCGVARLAYPANHIEADNRLSWLLGRLDDAYGNDAFYVHLQRNHEETADSFVKRKHFGIMQAYRDGILMGASDETSTKALALDYLDTVDANIALFLKDKRNTLSFHLETAKADFSLFWDKIQASGDLEKALRCWDTQYNASGDADNSTKT